MLLKKGKSLHLFGFYWVRNSHKEFTETPVFKALDQLGYSQEFLSTIDLELRHDLRFKYSDGIYGLTLFVTKTWFLFISKNDPSFENLPTLLGYMKGLRLIALGIILSLISLMVVILPIHVIVMN